MAIDLAIKEKAELVLATDPDADRIGVALPDENGEYVLLNGNQTCTLLAYYLMRRWSELHKLNGKQFVIKTIVTTGLINRVAESYGVKCFECLTGFKYIAEIIRNLEGKMQYIGGGEESFGFLAGDFVRDKDAVSACSLAAEAAAWAKSQGITLYELLKEIYVKYGFYKEAMIYIVRQGKEGAEEIKKMMDEFRANPPKTLGGSPIVTIKDYLTSEALDLRTDNCTPIEMERSNVLQFFTEDGTKISVRPSGTEPKIKFYIEVKGQMKCAGCYARATEEAMAKVEAVRKSLGI